MESDRHSDNKYRKLGLPGWMVNNIERLNYATNFDQYAGSPPESEGFLSDYVDNSDAPQLSNTSLATDSAKTLESRVAVKDFDRITETDIKMPSSIIEKNGGAETGFQCHHPLLNHLKQDEIFSSPDSTPCTTPEPSPIVRRKLSSSSDTVQTNPGRWFYIGKFNKLQKSKVASSNENRKCTSNSAIEHSREHVQDYKPNNIKLVISNFDINAVSPTSW